LHGLALLKIILRIKGEKNSGQGRKTSSSWSDDRTNSFTNQISYGDWGEEEQPCEYRVSPDYGDHGGRTGHGLNSKLRQPADNY
jgi:hypothetical protein